MALLWSVDNHNITMVSVSLEVNCNNNKDWRTPVFWINVQRWLIWNWLTQLIFHAHLHRVKLCLGGINFVHSFSWSYYFFSQNYTHIFVALFCSIFKRSCCFLFFSLNGCNKCESNIKLHIIIIIIINYYLLFFRWQDFKNLGLHLNDICLLNFVSIKI